MLSVIKAFLERACFHEKPDDDDSFEIETNYASDTFYNLYDEEIIPSSSRHSSSEPPPGPASSNFGDEAVIETCGKENEDDGDDLDIDLLKSSSPSRDELR